MRLQDFRREQKSVLIADVRRGAFQVHEEPSILHWFSERFPEPRGIGVARDFRGRRGEGAHGNNEQHGDSLHTRDHNSDTLDQMYRSIPLFLIAAGVFAQSPDWSQVNAETLKHYTAVVQM